MSHAAITHRLARCCLTVFTGLMCLPTMAHAVECADLEAMMPADDVLLENINTRVAGQEYRISRRKQLRINRVERVRLSGCQADIRVNVTLRRRIRRDAHGTIDVKGRLSPVDLELYSRGSGRNIEWRLRGSICIVQPRVTRVSLSRTLGIGERIYQWAANLVVPDSICEPLDVSLAEFSAP